jgi:hypothetical protein
MYDQKQFEGWEYVDWVDLQPMPGSFLSFKWEDYEIGGEVFHAANYFHAHYLLLHREIDKSGEQWQSCRHCNHHIRYAVVFRDREGRHHLIGQDCARFITSKVDRSGWAEKKLLLKITERETRVGKRFTLTFECPSWFWDIPKADRPAYTSVFKSKMTTKWMLTIWGETPGDVIKNLEQFKLVQAEK